MLGAPREKNRYNALSRYESAKQACQRIALACEISIANLSPDGPPDSGGNIHRDPLRPSRGGSLKKTVEERRILFGLECAI